MWNNPPPAIPFSGSNVHRILYAVGLLIALLIVVGVALPRHARFVVSETMNAPAATVFAQLNDLRRTQLWSDVASTDPNADVTFSGPARGTGATVTWNGAIAGSGTQTIVESRPHEYLETLINGGEPGESRTGFVLVPEPGATRVEWSFEHDYGYNLVGRYVGAVVTGIIRRDYTERLAALRELAESLPSADFGRLAIERVMVEPQRIAYKTVQSAPDAASISEALGGAYFDVLAFMDAQGLRQVGAPVAIARRFDGAQLRFDAGIPFAGDVGGADNPAAGVNVGLTPGGPSLRVRHVGPYRGLAETHRQIAAYLAALGIERNGNSWESYVSDPTEVPQSDLVTYVYYPVRDEP